MKFALCFLLGGLDFLKLAHLINLTKKERRIDKRGMILIIQTIQTGVFSRFFKGIIFQLVYSIRFIKALNVAC